MGDPDIANYLSHDRIEGGNNWWDYQLDHNWYFSPSTLKDLLTCAGFTDFKFAKQVFRPQWNNTIPLQKASLSNLLRRMLLHPMTTKQHIRRFKLLHESTTWDSPELPIITLSAKQDT